MRRQQERKAAGGESSPKCSMGFCEIRSGSKKGGDKKK